jgi:hypothetical protein
LDAAVSTLDHYFSLENTSETEPTYRAA